MSETQETRVLVQLFFHEELGATVLEVWRPDDDTGRSVVSLKLTADQAQQLYGGRVIELDVEVGG